MSERSDAPFVLLGAPNHDRRAAARSRSPRCCGLALIGCAVASVLALHWRWPRLSSSTFVSMGLVREIFWEAPPAVRRCSWVVEQTMAHNAGKSPDMLREQFQVQATDVNTFYRGTAYMFWLDFVQGGWGLFDLTQLGVPTTQADGTPLQRTSTWTWITGDQHLSNFGAWKNRNGDVIYGVNDFDEAAIFDFQVDVWRCAVSIYDHALANGLDAGKATAAVLTFTDSYLLTLQGYVGNDKASLFELTQQQATGKLADFLGQVLQLDSQHKMLDKYTELDGHGARRFKKSKATRLSALPPHLEAEVRAAIRRDTYGATLNKIGWHAQEWSDSFFRVLDVAARVGSGVGSYGVGRYYVLLAGGDGEGSNSSVILDVKAVPAAAVSKVLDEFDTAWYHTLFHNEAARAILAQRHLTTYTDPFAGWVHINGSAHVVRQRSPWKAGFDLNLLTTYADLAELVQQIAVVTATSHTRGTVGKSPGQFKEVISAALGPSFARATWGIATVRIAAAYREQVLLDYQCFCEFAQANYSVTPGVGDDDGEDDGPDDRLRA